MWRQDGRSASMTAPNGPSQQACILQSMREVSTSASSFQVNCSVQFTGFTRETMWPFGWQKSPLRPETRQEISIWQNAMAQVGCVFFLLTLSEVSSLKTNRMETTGARKTTRPFNLSLPLRYCFGWSYWGRCSEECHGTKGYYLGTDQLQIQHWAFGGQRRGIPVLVVGWWKLKGFFLRRNAFPWIWGWNCRLPEVRGEPKSRGIPFFSSNCWDANGVRCLRYLC